MLLLKNLNLEDEKMGSVKDLIVLEKPLGNKRGLGRFVFSDRYSVFDWGQMPDKILNKGRALAVMAAFNFEGLQKIGIATHYVGLANENGELIEFRDLKDRSNGSDTMQVELSNVYRPKEVKLEGRLGYDYSFYHENRGRLNNFLIPLEIIYRNGLPLGSSVFKKIEKIKNEIADPETREKVLQKIYEGYGLKSEPKPGDMLPEPVIGYTTKLEPGDRSLEDRDAYKLSGLCDEDFKDVKPLALAVNDFINKQAVDKLGLNPHWDGKVEMAYFHSLEIVDVVGTLDEDRFGTLVSKEILRQWYKRNQPEFSLACDEWKKTGEGWQERCPVKPVNLPSDLVSAVSQMYQAATN